MEDAAAVHSVSFDYSGSYLAVGTGDGNNSIRILSTGKEWNDVTVSTDKDKKWNI